MTSLGPGPGPSDWLALPKGDVFQHSQNSARVSVISDANNSETQRRALADCERSSRTWGAGPLGTGRG